jgi:hypothetical protein
VLVFVQSDLQSDLVDDQAPPSVDVVAHKIVVDICVEGPQIEQHTCQLDGTG